MTLDDHALTHDDPISSEEAPEDTRVVLISGGSKGLGLALVEECLDQGHQVATFSRRGTPRLEALQQTWTDDRLMVQSLDACDTAGTRAFVRQVVRRFGRVDVLVNNAATATDGLLALARPDDIERDVAVNVVATLNLTRLCAKDMLRRRSGCILNISSVTAERGFAGVAVYGATKAALHGLTRSLARELGPAGIRVNAVAPGYFASDMSAGLSDTQRRQIRRRTPLGRLLELDDVVGAVRFLLSESARFITGQVLVIDGGLTC